MNEYFKKMEPVSKTYIDVLYYEVEMLNAIEHYITEDQGQKNICLESFLIHARNLADFLSDERYSDDIKISDFEDNGGSSMTIIELDYDLTNNINYIHKQLAHISKKRTEEKFGWYMENIKNEINKGLNKFISNVNDKYFVESQRSKYDFLKFIKKDYSDMAIYGA